MNRLHMVVALSLQIVPESCDTTKEGDTHTHAHADTHTHSERERERMEKSLLQKEIFESILIWLYDVPVCLWPEFQFQVSHQSRTRQVPKHEASHRGQFACSWPILRLR